MYLLKQALNVTPFNAFLVIGHQDADISLGIFCFYLFLDLLQFVESAGTDDHIEPLLSQTYSQSFANALRRTSHKCPCIAAIASHQVLPLPQQLIQSGEQSKQFPDNYQCANYLQDKGGLGAELTDRVHKVHIYALMYL